MRQHFPTLDQLKPLDTRIQARNFIEVALMRARGDGTYNLAQAAAANGCSPLVLRALQADIADLIRKTAGGMMSDEDHAALAALQNLSASFLATAAHVGVFDALAADALPGALHSRFGFITVRPAAEEVLEGRSKPISRATTLQGTLQPRKSASIVVLSRELLRLSSAAAALEIALRESIASASDVIALAELATMAAGGPVVAIGTDAGGIRHDIRLALDALATGADSRLHLILPVAVAKRLAVASDAVGARAFPQMGTQGGALDSLTVTATEGLEDDALLIDARGLVAASDPITIDRSGEAAIQMTANAGDIVEPTETTLVSMFQTDSIALRAERRIGLAQVRAGSVVVIEDVAAAWGLDGGSPPA